MRDLIYMESFLASAVAIGKGSHALEAIVTRLEEMQRELRSIRDTGTFVIGARAFVRFPANDAEPGAPSSSLGEGRRR